ncbi:hypothetical protein L2Y96_21115 [Luteibacter aegosomaticola]|jgi:hypothetical protein|uniref:hypothetical protein n=1 Tax=Luteibacter aegosomaticola TaxID=2911538 RepID=UPI001FF8C78A|nr:hypothetical protein [Luteibacter aegosomaticola]UPG89859.1 hypothetical protein L2Y96_21115 [Luteibacter aegosomaticola]
MHYGIVRRIVTLAELIEPDRAQVWTWFFETHIQPLGGRPVELAFHGRGQEVVDFLHGVLARTKGAANIKPFPRRPRRQVGPQPNGELFTGGDAQVVGVPRGA